MTAAEYNYAVFNMESERDKFTGFQDHPFHVGRHAPDFALEDLETHQTVHLKDLWGGGLLVIEFGSYT